MLARYVLPFVIGCLLLSVAQAAGDERSDPAYAVLYFRHIDPDALVKEAAWIPRNQAVELASAVPFRRMAEPLLAVLSGRTPEGSLWTYSLDSADTDHLVAVLPT